MVTDKSPTVAKFTKQIPIMKMNLERKIKTQNVWLLLSSVGNVNGARLRFYVLLTSFECDMVEFSFGYLFIIWREFIFYCERVARNNLRDHVFGFCMRNHRLNGI